MTINRMAQMAIEKAVTLKATAVITTSLLKDHMADPFSIRSADPHYAHPARTERGGNGSYGVTNIHSAPISR